MRHKAVTPPLYNRIKHQAGHLKKRPAFSIYRQHTDWVWYNETISQCSERRKTEQYGVLPVVLIYESASAEAVCFVTGNFGKHGAITGLWNDARDNGGTGLHILRDIVN